MLVAITAVMVLLNMAYPARAELTAFGTATYDDGSGPEQYKLVYDDALGVIFLDYRKRAAPRADQEAWVADLDSQLQFNLDSGYTVVWSESQWRLPKSAGGAYKWGYDGMTNNAGYNVTSSEMGYLYYVSLGNSGKVDTSGNSVANVGLKNTGPFENLAESWYWSGTAYTAEADRADEGWIFTFYNGHQVLTPLERNQYGLAVRGGEAVYDPVTLQGSPLPFLEILLFKNEINQ